MRAALWFAVSTVQTATENMTSRSPSARFTRPRRSSSPGRDGGSARKKFFTCRQEVIIKLPLDVISLGSVVISGGALYPAHAHSPPVVVSVPRSARCLPMPAAPAWRSKAKVALVACSGHSSSFRHLHAAVRPEGTGRSLRTRSMPGDGDEKGEGGVLNVVGVRSRTSRGTLRYTDHHGENRGCGFHARYEDPLIISRECWVGAGLQGREIPHELLPWNLLLVY